MLLACYGVVLGLSLCSVVVPLVVMCVLSCDFNFKIPGPRPRRRPYDMSVIVNKNLFLTDLPSLRKKKKNILYIYIYIFIYLFFTPPYRRLLSCPMTLMCNEMEL